ncbi:MAG: hypothetical protein NVV57_05090 [Demequina sp.]|nr:hypothetical protein [Demequina sp.]
MSARIAIVSTRDLDVMDVDEELLFPLLPEAELAHWDDPNVNWAGYEVAILRSTWNYTEHLDEFLAWATRTSQVTRLVNPVDIVEWNTDKRYLADLAARGIPVVPTVFAAPGEPVSPDAVAGHVVVKPTVGAGSRAPSCSVTTQPAPLPTWPPFTRTAPPPWCSPTSRQSTSTVRRR